MSALVRAHGLTKFYGRSRGVLDLDFSVESGEVFGFLGPNGAGKTTTVRLMLDLIRPTRGRPELNKALAERRRGRERRPETSPAMARSGSPGG